MRRYEEAEPMGESRTGVPSRRVVVLATPTAQSLEVAGPIEVFATAVTKLREAGRARSRPYEVTLASCTDALAIRSFTSGLTINANCPWSAVQGEVDTLVVSGGMDVWTGADNPALLEWVRLTSQRARRTVSVCTGAFVLAEAGLLAGRRVTTHWYFSQKLQEDYPALNVDPEPLFIRDGNVVTAAGVASGLDLALSLVEEDFGTDIALRVARALVLFIRRSGGQSQFSTALAFQGSSRLPIRELPIWILEHLHRDLDVEALAARVAMSPRNFSRTFVKEFNVPPARFITRLRVETAVRLLEESDKSLEEIAGSCGFGSVDTMNRAFRRETGRLASGFRGEGGRVAREA
jgi:transcriptional regulator GlxA family with amidase domain